MTTVKFRLSETQMRKLASAHKNKTAVTLRLNKSMIAADGIPLTLTESEHKKLQSGKHMILELVLLELSKVDSFLY